MKIIILLNQPYPKGYALTKRLHLYVKGFIQNGHTAKFIIPKPTEKYQQSHNSSHSGIFEGIPYESAWRSCDRSKNFLVRRFHDFWGPIKSGFMLIKEKPDVVISPYFPPWYFFYIKLISFIASFKFVAEKCEVDYSGLENITRLQKSKLQIIDSVFDGIIVINEQLKKYHHDELKLNTPMVIVPILVEDYRQGKSRPIEKIILYTGTYLEHKDGILTIIKAFKLFSDEYPDYKLVMTGSPKKSPDYHKIINLIEEQDIKTKLTFTGYLSEDDLHNLILSARLLLIAKPYNRQNYYNFPTKIGEYLISGRPVLSTRVGVVGDIMTDEINIFFDECDANCLSNKMKQIIKDQVHADEVGEKGRQYALTYFDFKAHAQEMITFFGSL